MAKLLIVNVTYHTPQNRVSDTITDVTLNYRCTLFMVFNVIYIASEGPKLDA